MENGERLAHPDPARRPARAWRTQDGTVTITVGRLRGWYYVELRARDWRAHVYRTANEALLVAERVRASIPGHAWIELEPTHTVSV